MITLASVIHYPATKSVEATWVDAGGAQVKCHSYADVQMQMFRDDVATLGGSIAEYAALIATVEAGIVLPTAAELAQQKAIRLAQAEVAIKAERDRRKSGGILVSGKWYHSDRDSRIQQLGLVLMGASVPAVQWKTMDGSFVTMTPAIASAIFQATAALDMAVFANAEMHLAGARAAPEPSAYDYSTGWPSAFGG